MSEENTQRRGMMSQRIRDKSNELLGYEIDRNELRLMPYIIHVMMNEQRIEPRKINKDERDILQKWLDAGHIEGGVHGLSITEQFWNVLCEIVRLGYVDIDE